MLSRTNKKLELGLPEQMTELRDLHAQSNLIVRADDRHYIELSLVSLL